MTLHEIEQIYNAIESIKSLCSLPIKIKLTLYLSKIKYYKDSLDALKKEIITDDVLFFEKEKTLILDKYKDDYFLKNKFEELATKYPVQYEKYMETVKNIEIIYNYECDDVPTIKLTIDDIPDNIEDISNDTMEVIFNLVEDPAEI